MNASWTKDKIYHLIEFMGAILIILNLQIVKDCDRISFRLSIVL